VGCCEAPNIDAVGWTAVVVGPAPNKVDPESAWEDAVGPDFAPKRPPDGAAVAVEPKMPPLGAAFVVVVPNSPPLGADVVAFPNRPPHGAAVVVVAPKRDELGVVAGFPKLGGTAVDADMFPNNKGVEKD
jgi:hypothetical protein